VATSGGRIGAASVAAEKPSNAIIDNEEIKQCEIFFMGASLAVGWVEQNAGIVARLRES
jgi:hypothetical protein